MNRSIALPRDHEQLGRRRDSFPPSRVLVLLLNRRLTATQRRFAAFDVPSDSTRSANLRRGAGVDGSTALRRDRHSPPVLPTIVAYGTILSGKTSGSRLNEGSHS